MNKDLNAPVCDATTDDKRFAAGYIKKIMALVTMLLFLGQIVMAQYNPPGHHTLHNLT